MVFYTDGSCLSNGKIGAKGGFGVVGVNENTDKLELAYSDFTTGTTNNREEIKAILYVMKNYGAQDEDWCQPPVVYSDSSYCVNTFNTWMFGWARNGWIKSDKKVPENLDLIQEYYDLCKEGYKIDLRKIKGHAGEEWNELADQLARGFISIEEAYNTYGDATMFEV